MYWVLLGLPGRGGGVERLAIVFHDTGHWRNEAAPDLVERASRWTGGVGLRRRRNRWRPSKKKKQKKQEKKKAKTKLEQGEDEDDMVMITNEEEEEVVVEEEEETRKRKRLEKVDVDDNVSRWNSFLVLEHVDHRRRNPSHFCFFLGQPIFSPHYRVLFTEFVHRSSFLSIYLVLPSI